MKKNYFMSIFIATNLFFIFFQIYHQSNLIKRSLQKQKFEKYYEELLEQKKELKNSLQHLKNRSSIKESAQKMGMKPVRLTVIKKLSSEPPVACEERL